MEDETKELKESSEEQIQQLKEKNLYLQAEFENFKRRLERERGSWVETAQDTVLLDILPILDDMERALTEMQAKEVSGHEASHIAGFELITKSLAKILKKYGIEEIPYSKEFNPEFYEAIMQVPSETHSSGEIVSLLQKGYSRQGRILRPAKVSVAQ